ncbi:hypothetical protein Aduo_006541 [Ancylostoma duodenale]
MHISATSSKKMDDFAIRVFPSPRTAEMRVSSSVLHYSPIADPPIDYTLHKPKQNDHSNAIPWRNQEPQPEPQSSAYILEMEEQHRPKRRTTHTSPPKQKVIPRRHTTEISSANAKQETPDPDLETAKVLEDLDTILDEELSFEERRNRIEAIPLHPYPPDAFDQAEQELSPSQQQQKALSIEKARAQSRNRHSTPVPVLNDSIIEDLRSVTHGADISAINEHRKAMAIKLFKETERKIEAAKQRYTPEYLKVTKFTGPGIPPWKSDLLAKRYSSDFIRQYEEKAWREFSEWKKVNAPSVDLHSPYEFEFYRQPMLQH